MNNLDVISLQKEIRAKIDSTEKLKERIKSRVQEKARAISEYDKSLAIWIIKLNNLDKFSTIKLENEEIKGPVAKSSIEKLAKGLCWKEALKKEEADGLYKSVITGIELVKAELSALQSINRHLS